MEGEQTRSLLRNVSDRDESGARATAVEAEVRKEGELQQECPSPMFDETTTMPTLGSSPSDSKPRQIKARRSGTTGGESEGPPIERASVVGSPNPPLPQSHFKFSEQAPQPPAMMNAAVLSANGPLLPTKSHTNLAAAGGGIITNEKFAGLPLHTNDLETLRPHLMHFCHAYNVQMNVQAIRSSADEMELFSVINRKFRQIFNKQEEMLTFKPYDASKSSMERWGLDSWSRAVLKPSNWLPYIKIRPKRNEYLVKLIMELRNKTVTDDLLTAAANFLRIKSPEKVQDSLRHHAMLVQHPPMVHSASVVSHRQGQSTAEVFKKIYSSSDFYGKTMDSEERGKRQNEYDFTQAMQMLGLDDAANAKDDPSSVQGAYLSFLHLRHLKLRDVMRTCISVLNYFRSVERTLTINDQGLSMGSKGAVERSSPPNHRTGTEASGCQGGGNNIEGHGYLFNTPHEFKIKETEFIQFAEVDNHDDFYFHEEGRVHVRDQVGFWIIYDCTMEDFRKLEEDLLLLATAFVQKDTCSRGTSNFKRKQANAEGRTADVDIALYSHREVDRFGILYDMWTNECAFQEAKKKLMDVYMEAYGHIVCRDSRRRLAQVMTDLIHQRPRLDLNENYFVLAYRFECASLRQRTEIMRCALNRQIYNQREYLKKIDADKLEFGLPPCLVEKFPIAIHSDEVTLTPVHLLEFHPSLSCTPSLAEAMDCSVGLLYELFAPTQPMQEIVLDKRFFDFLRYEVENLKPLGASYTAQLQRDLEKSPSRDRMQNAFIKRTQGGGIASSKSFVESEKIKREFISQFCADFGERSQQISLRAQIIYTYSSILTILEKVPTITEDFFVLGYAFEKKGPEDDLDVQITDPRSLRTRPRRVLSTDGTKLYNLWFIPHFIEVLFIFRHLDDQSCTRALRCMARLACVLHDILHYLIAYARLGISSAKITQEQRMQITTGVRKNIMQNAGPEERRGPPPTTEEAASNIAGVASANTPMAQMVAAGTIGSMNMTLAAPPLSVTPLDLTVNNRSLVMDQIVEDISDFDGGPMSTLATELREIQYQINQLPDPTEPEQVIQLLTLRRDVMFLQFDVCIRTVLRETFLAAGNQEACREVEENSHFPLSALSNVHKPCLNAVELKVPEPLEARDEMAQNMFPWRSLMGSQGPFFLFCFGPSNVEYSIRMCLAGLRPVDRPTVHGELLAMNLSLEDVLDVGEVPEAKAGEPLPIQHAENMHCMLGKRVRDRRRELLGTSAVSPAASSATAGPPSATGSTNPTNAPTASTPAGAISVGSATQSTENAGQKSSHAATVASGIVSDEKHKLSTLDTPVEAYTLLKKFLILRKRVELLKYAWGKRRLGVESIDTPALFKVFCSIYKREKLYPLLRSLAIQYKQPDMYALGPLESTDVLVMPSGIPEMVVRQRQLLKLIEAFEFYMIADLRKLIVRQIDLVIKERNREEGNLPLDLWKRPAMKETLSIKRPALADELVVQLSNNLQHDEKNDTYCITKDALNEVIQTFAISVMRMQRESYESYSMYYENLLKNQHGLLYAKEREIEGLKEMLRQKDLETSVTVQFQMSEQVHNLLLEVTALRAKIAELEELNGKTEAKVRARVRREFSVAMRKLFGLSFEQKSRIDEYRDNLHAITLQRIAEVREEASAEMARIKERSGARTSAEDEIAERNLRLSREVSTLHQRNIRLQQMMNRLRVMAHWQQTTLRCTFEKQISGVEDQRNRSKTHVTRLGILSEQRVRLLNEEMSKLRDHLSNTEKHLNDMRKALDKELNDKVEKKHAAERKAATDKQMAIVKQMQVDQLMAEIEDKNAALGKLESLLDASAKSKKQEADKSVREVDLLRKQLREERKLKKAAIQKVDDLMTQLYEFETAYASAQAAKDDRNVCMNKMPEERKNALPGIAKTRLTASKRPTTYEELLSRKAGPYSTDHYLKFRREMVGVPQLRQRLAQELLRSDAPQTLVHYLRIHEDTQEE
ncbi:unnamed protein product [Dicrocoelium dendriticum]|nr:unnamed protein product [Dicrocoelium dendriticum]